MGDATTPATCPNCPQVTSKHVIDRYTTVAFPDQFRAAVHAVFATELDTNTSTTASSALTSLEAQIVTDFTGDGKGLGMMKASALGRGRWIPRPGRIRC